MGLAWAGAALAADLDEFRVKREQVFEFVQKPAVTRNGDSVSIAFEAKGLCDVTVAIENEQGRIIRHLASGVLGPKAPEPLQRNSRKQVLVWDGKNDQGAYVDDKDRHTVRVSLGLKPQFERTLFWSPKKRTGFFYPVLRAAPEGVYVADGNVVDHIRLYDHQGNYLRAVYPFPADKIDKVAGLEMRTFRQDGKALPLKRGLHQSTLMTCGPNCDVSTWPSVGYGYAVEGMAANNGRLALVKTRLNRLATDGSSGGLPFTGPRISLEAKEITDAYDPRNPHRGGGVVFEPLSAVLSPDAKWLYLAGYYYKFNDFRMGSEWMNAVLRMPYGEDKQPALFAGDLKQPGSKNGGAENGRFRMATSVACDAKGRVYVGDYMNDRVQVFDPDGKHLKSIPVAKPASVAVHQKSGDIYVFSWLLFSRMITSDTVRVEATLTHLGPMEDPAVRNKCPLPFQDYNPTVSWNHAGGFQYRAELDSWADQPSIWLVTGAAGGISYNDDGSIRGVDAGGAAGVEVFEETDGKLVPKCKFAADVVKSVVRLQPPILWRQRLYLNPRNERLYVGEGDSGVMKSFKQLVEIDPETGRAKLVELPFAAEDMAFDQEGCAYLRTDTEVVRYDPATWREIPWDYGEERKEVTFDGGSAGRTAKNVNAALPLPGGRPWCFHEGGMGVAPDGSVAVACANLPDEAKAEPRKGEAPPVAPAGKRYIPNIYPGRVRHLEIHVWDKHAKMRYEDAVPGLFRTDGLAIDRQGNLYALMDKPRVLDGKRYENKMTSTLMKFKPRKARIVAEGLGGGGVSVPVPLSADQRPDRAQDVLGFWMEGAEWFYGGLGWAGFNAGEVGGGCACWNCRFALDYFARSFAPETEHYSVAVLDTNGNLILRVGTYGNAEDGKPLITDGGPSNPRSIGGDEVALFHACYVGVHTDRRLFIADAGNARILSVKLDYHATEKVPLKAVPDQANRGR